MSGIIGGINESLTTVFATAPLEVFRILPNSLVGMSGLFAILTLSFPYTVLFGSLLESIGVFYALQRAVVSLNIYDILSEKQSYSQICNSGLNAVSLNDFAERSPGPVTGFPSYAIYILSFVTTYILGMYNTYSEELKALGDTRFFQAAIFLSAVLLIVVVVRMMYNCDGVGTVLFSILAGLFMGFLIIQQNIALFGKASLNLLGIPLLRGKAINGQALYICPTTNTY